MKDFNADSYSIVFRLFSICIWIFSSFFSYCCLVIFTITWYWNTWARASFQDQSNAFHMHRHTMCQFSQLMIIINIVLVYFSFSFQIFCPLFGAVQCAFNYFDCFLFFFFCSNIILTLSSFFFFLFNASFVFSTPFGIWYS